MVKRTKLTRTRAEAVDNFVTALRNENSGIDVNMNLNKFVADYKSGAQLIPGNYMVVDKPKHDKRNPQPVLVKSKEKAPWWKVLLGIH